MPDNPYQPPKEVNAQRAPATWWLVLRTAILGGFLAYIGVSFFNDMTAFEESGRSFQFNALFVLAYEFLGKWGAIIIYSLVVIVFLRITWSIRGGPTRRDK